MSIKVALINNDQVIADIKEVIDPENDSRQYLFNNPLKVILQPTMTLQEDASQIDSNQSQVSLATWQPLTTDSTFVVNPNVVQCVYEPIPDLRSMYLELQNGN
tara:strand:- start:3161 stop:3469 length:309 start_codon:yes stop_codon:yes gene_type:complete